KARRREWGWAGDAGDRPDSERGSTGGSGAVSLRVSCLHGPSLRRTKGRLGPARRTDQDYNAGHRTDHRHGRRRGRRSTDSRAHGTIRAVTTRRGARPSQVRPRPPSNGRPVQSAVRSRPSQTTRLSTHRKVERGPGIPWPSRLLPVAAVAALGVGVLIVASGGLGRVAASIGSSFGSFVTNITATPVPSASPIDVADAPVLDAPDEPYTNQES